MKKLVRILLIALATCYKKLQPHFDRALGVASLRCIRARGVCCMLEGDGRVIDPECLELGDHIYIGRNFFIRATGGVRIGSYSHISRNVTIHTVNHNVNGVTLPYDRVDVAKRISIGRYVWIGMNCSILPGVTIGDGAVIGMNTVVTKDVAPGAIVVGAAQRVVGQRDPAATEELEKNNMFLLIENGWASHG